MLEKIKNTDFRGIAVMLGTIGFFLVFGSAGASDAGEGITEFLPYASAGVITMCLSSAYILWYEYILN